MLFGPQVAQPLEYEDAISSTVEKAAAGYPVSIVDACKSHNASLILFSMLTYFFADGRFISYHLFNDTNNPNGVGSETLFSSIKSTPSFKSSSLPFPMMVTCGREVGAVNVTIASPMVRLVTSLSSSFSFLTSSFLSTKLHLTNLESTTPAYLLSFPLNT